MLSDTGLPFESGAQRDAHLKLRAPLEESFPGHVTERIHAIGWTLRLPSGDVVTSTLASWGEDGATIAVRSYLAGAVPMSLELLRELARWTSARRYGVFGVDDDDNVYFEEQLLPAAATAATMRATVRDVLAGVAEHRVELRSRFGGGDL